MSWLSPNLNISDSLSSLTNITGQISNFTREMLTEGTEEVAGKHQEFITWTVHGHCNITIQYHLYMN